MGRTDNKLKQTLTIMYVISLYKRTVFPLFIQTYYFIRRKLLQQLKVL